MSFTPAYLPDNAGLTLTRTLTLSLTLTSAHLHCDAGNGSKCNDSNHQRGHEAVGGERLEEALVLVPECPTVDCTGEIRRVLAKVLCCEHCTEDSAYWPFIALHTERMSCAAHKHKRTSWLHEPGGRAGDSATPLCGVICIHHLTSPWQIYYHHLHAPGTTDALHMHTFAVHEYSLRGVRSVTSHHITSHHITSHLRDCTDHSTSEDLQGIGLYADEVTSDELAAHNTPRMR